MTISDTDRIRIKRAMEHEGCTQALAMVVPQTPAPKWDDAQQQAFLDRLPATCEDIAVIVLSDQAIMNALYPKDQP